MDLGDTIIPWSAEWLMYYELWLATDASWLGGGHSSSPTPVDSAARRSTNLAAPPDLNQNWPAQTVPKRLFTMRSPSSQCMGNVAAWWTTKQAVICVSAVHGLHDARS
jgi:hypothetical protein